MTRLAVLFINFGPYHIARLKALYETFPAQEWEIIGIEIAHRQLEYPWQRHSETAPIQLVTIFPDRAYESIPIGSQIQAMYNALSQIKPDILAIAGYSEPMMLTALGWAKLNQKHAILLSESKLDDKPRYSWKEYLKKKIIRFYDAALVGGQPHKRYLMNMGMPEAAIAMGYDVVDNDIFDPRSIRLLSPPLTTPYFLSVSRFLPKKNISFMLKSYAEYRSKQGPESWDLVICGDGELQQDIAQEIAHLSLETCVHLPGFLQQQALLPYFAHAHAFIHPSRQEQWGLVVNEAMAAGLPVLVSDQCGCFEDLIIDGITGFGFSSDNLEQLTHLMLKMSSGFIDLSGVGAQALEHIRSFSPVYFAEGMQQAIDYARGRSFQGCGSY
jgi:1,2-diacylglycerol 3-alpha-glucosyltransferase